MKDQWGPARADLLASLDAMGGDATRIADEIRKSTFSPERAIPTLRAWAFVTPDGRDRLGALDTASRNQCGGPAFDDLSEFFWSIPRLTDGLVTNSGDMFGCSGDLLGWVELQAVWRCEHRVVVVDYANADIRSLDMSPFADTDGSAPYPTLVGEYLAWMQRIVHPATGLAKPTFDVKMYHVDLRLQGIVTDAVETGLEASEAPGVSVDSLGEKFALVRTWWYGIEERQSIWNFGPKEATRLPLELPDVSGGMSYDGRLNGFVPLFTTLDEMRGTIPLYFSHARGDLVRNITLSLADDAGCGRLGLGTMLGSKPGLEKTVLVSSTPDALTGRIVDLPDPRNIQFVTINGAGFVYRKNDGGHALQKWDGSTGWVIDYDVANLFGVVGKYLVMENKSGKGVVVDGTTGLETDKMPADVDVMHITDVRVSGGHLLVTWNTSNTENTRILDYEEACSTTVTGPALSPVGPNGIS